MQIYRRDITVAAINVMNRLDMGRPAAVAGGGHGHGSGCCLLCYCYCVVSCLPPTYLVLAGRNSK
jgi:hypothetical protein